MSSHVTTKKKPSVSERCCSSLGILRKIVVITSQPGYDSSSITHAQVQEELDRLSLFIGNMGALHRPQSSLSIESRLSEAHDVLLHMTNLLEDLGEAAEELLEIVSGGRGDMITTSDGLEEDREEISEADELRKEINETIDRLFRASVVIRQAAPTDAFTKALSRDRYRFDGQSDINHVGDKYCKLAENDHAWLRRRLGRAITDRRCYLSYIQDHHDKLEGTHSHRDTADDSAVKIDAPALNQPLSSDSMLETATNPSRFTKATFAPAQFEPQLLATQDVGIEEEDNLSYTTITRSIDEDNEPPTAIRIPNLNDLRNGRKGEFECPFCFRIKNFKKEQSWRKHVFSDLRSYVCTFPDCDAPYFRDINDWFSHEMRVHRVEYKCFICPNATFSKETFYTAHLKQKHADILRHDMGIDQSMIDLARNPLAQIKASDCPCCYDWVDRLRNRMIQNGEPGVDNVLYVVPTVFKRHLASHLEQLALFAIPISATTNDDSDDQTSEEEESAQKRKSQACREALFLTDPDLDREMLLSRIDGKTPVVFRQLQTLEYFSWRNINPDDCYSEDDQRRDIQRLLLICGDPDVGKTTLSIFLLRELESSFTATSAEVIFFFCDYQIEKRNNMIAVLRGLLYQIITKKPQLIKHALRDFETPEDIQQTLLSFERLWDVFSKLIMDTQLGAMFCVLDAIDECEEHDREEFLSRIVELLAGENETRKSSFRLVITGRHLQRLRGIVLNHSQAYIDMEQMRDTKLYLAHQLTELTRINGFENMREYVQSILLQDFDYVSQGRALVRLESTNTCSEVLECFEEMRQDFDMQESLWVSGPDKPTVFERNPFDHL